MYVLLVIGIGYFFGCMNGSQIIGSYKNINIKNNGMKNAGATNTTILLGWKYGVIVAIIDILKVILSLSIIALILNTYDISPPLFILLLYINALFVVLGHNYPIQMNFKGGKGTASLFGFLLYLDWKFAIVSIFVLLLFAIMMNYFVLGTFMVYISFIIYSYVFFGKNVATIAIVFFILFLLKHTENIKRIINKEEIKVLNYIKGEMN